MYNLAKNKPSLNTKSHRVRNKVRPRKEKLSLETNRAFQTLTFKDGTPIKYPTHIDPLTEYKKNFHEIRVDSALNSFANAFKYRKYH